MNNSVPALILLFSSIMLSLVVVQYAVDVCNTFIDTSASSEMQKLQRLIDQLQRQTENMTRQVANQTRK